MREYFILFALFFLITFNFIHSNTTSESKPKPLLLTALESEKNRSGILYDVVSSSDNNALVRVIYNPSSNCPVEVIRRYTLLNGSFDYMEDRLSNKCGVIVRGVVDTPSEAITMSYKDPYIKKNILLGVVESVSYDGKYWVVVWNMNGYIKKIYVSESGDVVARD